MTKQEFDFSVDILASLLWQHNNATNVRALLESKKDWYDENQKQFWENWVRDVFDLRTANSFGLQVWSIILGVPLTVTLPPSAIIKPNFGFGPSNKNFGRGNFGQIGSLASVLSDDQARMLLRLRYFQLISNGTVPEINRFMASVFKEYGKVYVVDDNAMHMRYVFTFSLPAGLKTILDNYDILPRPAGVRLDYVVTTRPAFGFGAYNRNFNNGMFAK